MMEIHASSGVHCLLLRLDPVMVNLACCMVWTGCPQKSVFQPLCLFHMLTLRLLSQLMILRNIALLGIGKVSSYTSVIIVEFSCHLYLNFSFIQSHGNSSLSGGRR